MSRRTSATLLALAVVAGSPGHAQRATVPPVGDFFAAGPAEPLPAPLSAAIARLNTTALAVHIALLASPSMEGRGLGSRGLDAAVEYVAATLALSGVAPVEQGDGRNALAGYSHPVPLREITRGSGQIEVEARRGDAIESTIYSSGVDFLFPELPPGILTAPAAFAGFGIRETAPSRDDYRGLDVKGKLVVILDGVPPGSEWQRPEVAGRYLAKGTNERFAVKLETAAALGALGVIAIEGDDFGTRLAAAASKPPPAFYAPFEDDRSADPPLVRVSRRAGDAMLEAAGLTSESARTAAPRPLPGVTVSIRLNGDERIVSSRNVFGVLLGADGRLREEAVIVGAHMDHLGRSGETVYPGADDNASGVAALLEVAKALESSDARPKRTLVFAFWTGEEEGHLGSRYYVRRPLWPIERTTVYLNLDMIGHAWTSEEIRKLVADAHPPNGEAFLAAVEPADFVELGVAEWAPDLVPLVARAAHATGLALHVDRTSGRYGGSDYRAFARKGVPFVRFFGNFFDGYHEPQDTADRLDASQVLRMARVALVSAWLAADR